MSDFLPQEVVTSILIRLPVESLLRFRCVCKHWLSIISNPNFISEHLAHSSSTSPHTLIRHYNKLYGKEVYTIHPRYNSSETYTNRVSFPFRHNARFFSRVVGYCHGIICLSDDLFSINKINSITLWNPSIKRAMLVPTPEFVCDCHMVALGFGFDCKSKDYKVVRVCYKKPDKRISYELPPKVEVFRVSTGKWTSLKPLEKTKTFITERFWNQVVFEGFVHWNGYKLVETNKEERPYTPYCNVIVKFDLAKEVFEELSLPQVLVKELPMCISPVILKGNFSVLQYDSFFKATGCSIWVMKDYGDVGSWTEKYKINLEVRLRMGMVLGMRKDGEIMFTTEIGELASYNSESGVVTSREMIGSARSFFVDDYVDSLVLFDKGKSVKEKAVEEDSENHDLYVEEEEYTIRKDVFLFLARAVHDFDDYDDDDE